MPFERFVAEANDGNDGPLPKVDKDDRLDRDELFDWRPVNEPVGRD